MSETTSPSPSAEPGFAENAPDMGATFEAANVPGHSENPEVTPEPELEPAPEMANDAPSYEQNAPDFDHAFETAHDGSEPELSEADFLAMRAREAGINEPDHAQELGRIATRAELDQRLEARATPDPTLDLTPGGSVETSTHKQIDQDNERQLFLIQRRLESQRTVLTHQFTHNR